MLVLGKTVCVQGCAHMDGRQHFPVNPVVDGRRRMSTLQSSCGILSPFFLESHHSLSSSLCLYPSHPLRDYRFHSDAADWLGSHSDCGCHGNTHMLVFRSATAVGVCRTRRAGTQTCESTRRPHIVTRNNSLRGED